MPTDQRNLLGNLTNDADFRAWGSGISAQIAAVGLVQTADTGQINWTTVARASAANTAQGYEIWRFNDALQATKPVFIKLEYGSANVVASPGLRIQVGTATNGAGAFSGSQIGTISAGFLGTANLPTAGTTWPSWCFGTTSRLVLATDLNTSLNAFLRLIVIERPRTSAGVDTGDGIVTMWTSQSITTYQIVPYAGSIPAASNTLPFIDPTTGGMSATGSDVALVPPILGINGKMLFGSLLMYRGADISGVAQITVDYLGATRTYQALGFNGGNRTQHCYPSGGAVSLAIPWS